MATKASQQNLNVFKKPLGLFSLSPKTGFYRDGYCRSGPEDTGNHAIAAQVTSEFLQFSASRGNDLRSIPGMAAGCKWCLCTSRWKEAMDAAKGPDDPVVPKVFLHATDESALEKIGLKELEKWAAEGEVQGGSGGRSPSEGVALGASPDGRGPVRETH